MARCGELSMIVKGPPEVIEFLMESMGVTVCYNGQLDDIIRVLSSKWLPTNQEPYTVTNEAASAQRVCFAPWVFESIFTRGKHRLPVVVLFAGCSDCVWMCGHRMCTEITDGNISNDRPSATAANGLLPPLHDR